MMNKVAIPMNGRTMHDLTGKLSFLPYGRQGQFINSISRSNLNIVLMNHAEQSGAQFFFNHRCINVNFAECSLELQHSTASNSSAVVSAKVDLSAVAPAKADQRFDLIIGADGAFVPGVISAQDILLTCICQFIETRPLRLSWRATGRPKLASLVARMERRPSLEQEAALWWEPGVTYATAAEVEWAKHKTIHGGPSFSEWALRSAS